MASRPGNRADCIVGVVVMNRSLTQNMVPLIDEGNHVDHPEHKCKVEEVEDQYHDHNKLYNTVQNLGLIFTPTCDKISKLKKIF